MIDVRPEAGPCGGLLRVLLPRARGAGEGVEEDDYDAFGDLYFEDPAHELFDFISGLEGLDEDSGRLGA